MTQPSLTLAEPLAQIFANRAEADWAFDLLRDTTKRLGIQGAYDPRFALTLARRGGQLSLHLNFGGWLVLGFHGPGRVDLTLLANRVAWDERFDSFPFESKEGEPEARSYHLPLEVVRPMSSDLQAAWEATLDFIAQKFQNWKRTIPWKQNNPEIIEALFKPEQRERLFAGLLTEPELRYERHLTAFYQDVSEEPAEYEVKRYPELVEGEGGEGEAKRRGGEEAMIKENVEVNQLATQTNYFTTKSFDLLAQLHANPTKDFYFAHKEEFKACVEEPFQQLFQQVAAQLPSAITDLMETKKRVFAKILKNDYGQGGAWDFYWGAFYPKGGKRTEDAQLSMWINYERLEFGFYIGEYGSNQRKRFIHNCQKNYEILLHLLKDVLTGESVVFGSHENIIIEPDGSVISKLNLSWQEWLQNPNQGNFDVSIALPKQKVLQFSTEELTSQIVQIYSKLFPLVLLATSDSPIPSLTQYLESATKETTVEATPPASSFIPQPSSLSYPLSQLSQDTGLDEADLARWIRAIERKKQIVLYGPPGTGKTFVAEKLAQHLVSGGDGFWELVQFHPSYAYEDFIQGIRPESQGDHLSYPMKPGRFLEFCRLTARHTSPCILIIDEINRANLSRVFGELMYLLEYRDRTIHLAGGGLFHIPANVRLIGTMNTADRSIALVDHALRRRFAFIALYPHYGLLRRYHEREQTGFPSEKLIALLQKLNRAIGDPHYAVGVTFFLRPNLAHELEDIWRMEIEPYLEEYFFDRPEAVEEFGWEKIKSVFNGD